MSEPTITPATSAIKKRQHEPPQPYTRGMGREAVAAGASKQYLKALREWNKP